MAGRKLKLNSKVPSSTILEVVIAMVLIVIVFGIAMTIFANILRTTLSVKQLRAQALLQEIFSAGSAGQTIENRTFQSGDFTITQTVSPYGGGNDLVSVQLEAFDRNNESTAVCRKVILIAHE